MADKKEFICRFRLPNGMFTMVVVSGRDLDAKKAEINAIRHMEKHGRVAEFVKAYER